MSAGVTWEWEEEVDIEMRKGPCADNCESEGGEWIPHGSLISGYTFLYI